MGQSPLALLRASSHVLCDRPMPLVEQSTPEPLPLMRMPQVHCAELPQRRRSRCSARRSVERRPPAEPPRCSITSAPTRSFVNATQRPMGGWRSSCYRLPGPEPASPQPPCGVASPLAPGALPQPTGTNPPGSIHPGARSAIAYSLTRHGGVIGETAAWVTAACCIRESPRRYRRRAGQASPHPGRKRGGGCWRQVLGAISIGTNTRIGAGSVVVRDVEADCTVVGIPGRVIHQSGVRINPLAHWLCLTQKRT